ncbi:hypothetical protein HZY97_16185 [Sphingomonas sp. R-74633]|uniref:hypothetical protein n=1 Tax=Sphingomonas sp. R-74633 TaxID=2751188 RepID=UPI0015D409A3|nr:hypothetical protein [Sphingomonas sp. R-74633]NYT42312.1 hypothetical protein [Sphingomonas sp. R-74633]
MKTIGGLVTAPLKALGIIPSAPPQLPAPTMTPTRDAARDAVAASDEIRRRRGGAADVLTSRMGAEADAGATGKQTLGS